MKKKQTKPSINLKTRTATKSDDEPGVVQRQMAGMPWKYTLSGMGALGIIGALSGAVFRARAKRNQQALDIVKGQDVRQDL